MFHTGSLAEFHEYPLRHLLHLYTSKLSGLPCNYSDDIISKEEIFHNAVQKYKTVVTHYLASKQEIWIALFMKPIYNVDGGLLTYEFAKSRGAIHYHSLLTQNSSPTKDKISEATKATVEKTNFAMETLNEFIQENCSEEKHKQMFVKRPDLMFNEKK